MRKVIIRIVVIIRKKLEYLLIDFKDMNICDRDLIEKWIYIETDDNSRWCAINTKWCTPISFLHRTRMSYANFKIYTCVRSRGDSLSQSENENENENVYNARSMRTDASSDAWIIFKGQGDTHRFIMKESMA